MKLFAQHFKPFIDRKIKDALAPYTTLHGYIDDMECQVNERLRAIIIPNLARFKAALEKARADITAL